MCKVTEINQGDIFMYTVAIQSFGGADVFKEMQLPVSYTHLDVYKRQI